MDDVQRLIDRMDEGFKDISGKVDALKDDFIAHIPKCMEHFSEIDKWISVREAVNGVRREQDIEKRDWGKWIVRGSLGAIGIAALSLVLGLLNGSIKVVAG